MEWKKPELPAGLEARVTALAEPKVAQAINQKDKHTRVQAVERVKREIADQLKAEYPDNGGDVHAVLGDVEYNALRAQVLDTKLRVDGRKANEVRQITIDTPVLPRAHGSALFTRGQTQALVSVTLGTANDVQRLDSIDEPQESTKSFMLHYNFPPFSTGEVRPMRGTSPPRDRPRQPGRARAAGHAPAVRGVPVHDPHRVRRPRVQRLVAPWPRSAAARSPCSTPASR